MSRQGFSAIACCLLLVAASLQAAEPQNFRCSKEIQSDSTGGEAILGVEFDADVYQGARNRFSDLRIFDPQGRETPFIVEKVTEPRTRTVQTACDSTVVSLDQRDDALEVHVRLDPQAAAADGLSILTPLKNFERRVRVDGSDDAVTWTPLVDAGLVFDYSRFMDVSNREIQLPKNDFRHFRIRIEGIDDTEKSPLTELTRRYRGDRESERIEKNILRQRPFRIDRIELWRRRQEKIAEDPKTIDYPITQYRVEENPDDRTTIVTVSTRREPLTQLLLETTTPNFSREAVVQTPVAEGEKTRWIDVGRGRLSRINFADYHKESLDLPFPERRETTYRIVIHNEDNPPLAVAGVAARGDVYRAVFLAAPDQRYRLCYGSATAETPRYDAAAVLTPLRKDHPIVEARLGPQIVGAVKIPPRAFSLRDLLENRTLLGIVVVALIVLLAAALYHASKRIGEIPRE